MTGPVFRMAPADRLAYARTRVGENVTVVIDRHRDGRQLDRVSGELITAARMISHGTSSDVLVVRIGGRFHDAGVSLALVRSIDPWQPDEQPAGYVRAE